MSEPRVESAPDAQPNRPPLWRVAVLLLVSVGLLAGLPYVRGVPPLVGTIAATVIFLLLTLLLIREMAKFPLRPLYDGLGLVLGLALWWAAGEWWELYRDLRPLLGAVSGLLFLLACVFFGRLLALIVRERGMLLPVAIIAGLADIFTVFFGPTGEALEKAPKLVQKLSVGIPEVGSATGAAGAAGVTALATAGLGDFIFLAFFFVGVYRFGLRRGPTFWVIFILTLVGMSAVLLLPEVPALPLLPFIVLGFLLANIGAFRLTRTEELHTVIAVGLVAALLAVAAVMLHGGGD